MFFLLSKLLLWLTQPAALVGLGLFVALWLLQRGRLRAGKRWVLACLALVISAGILPSSSLLLLPLEERFPRTQLAPGDAVTGIIVLGGAEDPRVTGGRGIVALGEAGERLSEAMVLSHRFPKARLVFSGGAIEIVSKPAFGADTAELFFREQGLDMRRLTLERHSRNTHENAVMTTALVAPKPGERWLLVTSAFHMPRAMGCFRQVGWDILPWPVDYRTAGPGELLVLMAYPAVGFQRFDVAMKEWVGLLVYRLTGRTGALFPRPSL